MRHFQAKDVDINSQKFKSSNEMFRAMMVQLKKEGLATVVHKPAITPEDMRKLYDSEALSVATPGGLQNKVFVDIMIHFCNRGRENLRDMQIRDFQVKTDAQGTKFVVMNDKMTKNHRDDENASQGGRMYQTPQNEMCPVNSFLKYVSKLNTEVPYFWQRPKANKPTQDDENTWYEKSPLGKNTLGNKMKMLSNTVGLSKVYTNHSLRATCITELDNQGFESRQIMAVSGHRSETSLKHYARVNSPQKKRMSEALTSIVNTTQAQSSVAPVQVNNNNDDIGNFDLDFESILTASQESLINNTIDFRQTNRHTTQQIFNISHCVVNISK